MILTIDQKNSKYCQEMYRCKECKYADQEAIKNYMPCCTYGFKLDFDNDGKRCLTKKRMV